MLKEMREQLLDRFSKGTMIQFLYAVLAVLLTSAPVSCDEGAEVRKNHAENVCNNLGLGIFENSAGSFCCLCPPASYLSQACDVFKQQPDERVCEKCIFDPNDPNNQEFMPEQNNETYCYKAHGKNYCDSFMNTRRVNGTMERNSGCECNPGYHSANSTGDVTGGCHEHSPCREGFQPSHLANSKSDTLCEICPNGTFSNMSSLTAECVQFTLCESNQTRILGNSTHDSTCISFDGPSGDTTAANSHPGKFGLNPGDIAGIVFGVVFVIIGALIVIYCIRRRCRTQRPSHSSPSVEMQQLTDAPPNGAAPQGEASDESQIEDDNQNHDLDRLLQNGGADDGRGNGDSRNVEPQQSSNEQLQVELPTRDDDASADTSQDSRVVSEKRVVVTSLADSDKKDEAGPSWDGSGTERAQGRLEFSPFQNGLDGSTSSTHQPPEDSSDLAGSGEAAASALPSGNGDNGQVQPTRSTTTGDQNANGQGDISSSDDHSGQLPSDSNIQRNHENGSEAKNESTPIPEEITPEQTKLSAYLNELDFFGKHETNEIQNSGCDRNLLKEALETNHEIAKSMLRVLPANTRDEDVFDLCQQLGLPQIDRDDIEIEERHSRRNVRSRCIKKVIQRRGRNLVPKLIFKMNFKENAALKDTLFDKFIEELKSSVSDV